MAQVAFEERLSYLEGWKDGIDPRIDRIEKRLDRIEERIDSLDAKLDRRLDALDARMTRLFFGGFGFLAVLMTIFKFVG